MFEDQWPTEVDQVFVTGRILQMIPFSPTHTKAPSTSVCVFVCVCVHVCMSARVYACMCNVERFISTSYTYQHIINMQTTIHRTEINELLSTQFILQWKHVHIYIQSINKTIALTMESSNSWQWLSADLVALTPEDCFSSVAGSGFNRLIRSWSNSRWL